MREINEKGLALLKQYEGCKLTAYQDIGGIWTIGYGCTGADVVKGLIITQQEAEQRLKDKLQMFYTLDNYLSEQVNENQYSALICLAYNVGLRAVKLSQTLKLINAGKDPDKEWVGFSHVNGVTVPGLLARRKAELKLYHTLG